MSSDKFLKNTKQIKLLCKKDFILGDKNVHLNKGKWYQGTLYTYRILKTDSNPVGINTFKVKDNFGMEISFHTGSEFFDVPVVKEEEKRYFEFDEHEYYALITVNSDDVNEAAKIYIEIVNCGDGTIKDVLEEGTPKQVVKEYAFFKYVECIDGDDELLTAKELLDKFEHKKNTVILVSGQLA